MAQDKTMRDGDEDPILRPHPAPLPFLISDQYLMGEDHGSENREKRNHTRFWLKNASDPKSYIGYVFNCFSYILFPKFHIFSYIN